MQELYHYGVKRKSGRYKWGSGKDPYQSEPGKQKKRWFRKSKEESKEVVRKGGLSAQAIEKKKLLADKERVLREGSATEVKKYQGMLTNKELSDVLSRLNMEAKISEISSKEVGIAMKEIDKYMKNLKTFNEWASVGTDTYNMIASVYNATAEGKKKPLTEIKKSGGGKGK